MSDKCKNCGSCCLAHPCVFGVSLLNGKSPCPALEKAGKKFLCGLITHPSKYVDVGKVTDWKNQIISELVIKVNGVGMGCGWDPMRAGIVRRMAERHEAQRD